MTPLPPGQRARPDFPRFGVPAYAAFDGRSLPNEIEIKGDVGAPSAVSLEELRLLARHDFTADFHCVTTWSHVANRWSGYSFAAFFERFVAPLRPDEGATWIKFKGADGHSASLCFEDALSEGVWLVDELDGQPLGFEHGAPLRLIAPAHYGYKSVKHLASISLYPAFRGGSLEHPRARVAAEERGPRFPGRVLRYVYRPLINRTVKTMAPKSAR